MNNSDRQLINQLNEEQLNELMTDSYDFHEMSFHDLPPEILATISSNTDEYVTEPIIYRAMTVQHPTIHPSFAMSCAYDDHTSTRLDDEEVVTPAKLHPIDYYIQTHEYNPLEVLSSWGELPSYLTTQAKEKMQLAKIDMKNSPAVEQVVQLNEKPIYLMPTHVHCSLRLQSIYDIISNFFINHPEINYHFDPVTYKWSAMFVKGCKSLHFDIQIYLDEPNPQYIVEMSRRKGDCPLFYPIFYELKSSLTSAPSSSSYARGDSHMAPSVRNSIKARDGDNSEEIDETKTCLQNLLDILNSPYVDSQEEVMKQLCQMSSNAECVQQLHKLNIFEALKTYICSNISLEGKSKIDCDEIYNKQWALLTLCNFSESLAYQSDISTSGIIPYLMNMCSDGEYHSYDGRCASARILANVTSQNSAILSKEIDPTILRSWVQSVDTIQNQKIRIHAERAKLAFHDALSSC